MIEEDGARPTPEDLSIKERIEESYSQAVEWTSDLLDILEYIETGDYVDALAEVVASQLPEEVKARFEPALVTNDPEYINRLADQYRGRLGNVFCESCWK